MKSLKLICALALVLAAASFAPLHAAGSLAPSIAPHGSPSDVIKAFYAQLVGVNKSGASGYAARFKKLQPIINAAYNMPLMTRLAVGPSWADTSPDEQQQLITAFSDFSTANYASRFGTFDDKSFSVTGEKPAGDGVMVQSTLSPQDHDPVAINYLLKKDESGSYRIVDVFLDGSISELATRRSEFGAIVKREGVTALVNTLSAKSKQMGPS